MENVAKGIVALLGAAVFAEALGTAYFYRRTMMRSNAKTERTMKMSGTDWTQHFPLIEQRKEWMLQQPHEDVWITSQDGLKLHGTYFMGSNPEKIVICFHGYTSKGMNDYIGLSDYYLKHGFGMLLVDLRAHGESEGEYIGFGCMDRLDAVEWMKWVIQKLGKNVQILLHGSSMGAATVLMTSGLTLPEQVKGIIADSAFTSPKYVFTHVLHSMYHLPAFPMIQISDRLNRRFAGYGLDECNAAREVRKASVPILLIHGSNDTFVPPYMCDEIYVNCASQKTKLIIPGAGHMECYYKDMERYEQTLDSFIGGVIVQ